MEIKTSPVFTWVFAGNTILSCFFFFFLIIDFPIVVVITQIFVVAAQLAITTGIPTNKAKAETEAHPVTVETKVH